MAERTKSTGVATKRKPRKKHAKISKKKPGLWPLIAVFSASLIFLSPFYYGYVLKFFTATKQWVRHMGEDPEYPHYSSFEINIPSGFEVHGIDVSYAQGKIDWKRVSAMREEDITIDFAFIKATEGLFKVDPWFQRNWREAAKSGIKCGAYHFFRPRKDGGLQAKFFLQTVPQEHDDLPMVIDIETLDGCSPEKMRRELLSCLKHIERRTGCKPIIYTGMSFYNDYLNGFVDGYKLWIAHYYKRQLKTRGNSEWLFWQHSDKARISGINHVVDFNIYKGTMAEFERNFGK